MNSGSRDSFQVCWRCGASPNAFQVRCVADGAVWLQTSMDTDAERAARLANDYGINS